MARPSDPELLVLQALRLRSFAALDVVADAAGLPASQVDEMLTQFNAREWARHRSGALTGWMLTPVGRAEGEQRLAIELDGADARADVDAAYRQFLALNQPLLQICTDWQLRAVEGGDPVLNDHRDQAHDQNVIAALRSLNAEVQPIVTELASMFDRFAGYGPRLTHALERVEAGEHDHFTKPTIDSYHTVWFELHENLLSTLGIPRGGEEPT